MKVLIALSAKTEATKELTSGQKTAINAKIAEYKKQIKILNKAYTREKNLLDNYRRQIRRLETYLGKPNKDQVTVKASIKQLTKLANAESKAMDIANKKRLKAEENIQKLENKLKGV